MKDAYSCDRDEAGLDASYWAQHGAYVRIFERLGLETIAVALGRRDDGRQPGPRVHGPQPGRRGRPRPVRGVRLRGQPPGRGRPEARARRRGAAAARGGRDARHDDDRDARGVPRHRRRRGRPRPRSSSTGDGRLVTAIVRGDYEVNETKLVNAVEATGGLRPATVEEIKAAGMEPGYGSPIGAHDTVVVVDDLVARSPNLVAGANREGFHYRNVNVGARLHARRRRRHHERPGGRSVPELRPAGHPAQRHRGRQHLQARDEVHRRVRGDVPRRGRRGAPDRHGLVRDRRRAERRLHRRGPPRRQGHRLAGRGRALRRPPRLDRRGQGAAGRSRSPSGCTTWRPRPAAPRDPVGRPRRVAGRQVHRRRAARHALDPDGQSPRSLAAGGIEVTERATGERSTRPIEEVEALPRRGLRGRRRPAVCRLDGIELGGIASPSARHRRRRSPRVVDRRAVEREDERRRPRRSARRARPRTRPSPIEDLARRRCGRSRS